jgi:hypothetical protein
MTLRLEARARATLRWLLSESDAQVQPLRQRADDVDRDDKTDRPPQADPAVGVGGSLDAPQGRVVEKRGDGRVEQEGREVERKERPKAGDGEEQAVGNQREGHQRRQGDPGVLQAAGQRNGKWRRDHGGQGLHRGKEADFRS